MKAYRYHANICFSWAPFWGVINFLIFCCCFICFCHYVWFFFSSSKNERAIHQLIAVFKGKWFEPHLFLFIFYFFIAVFYFNLIGPWLGLNSKNKLKKSKKKSKNLCHHSSVSLFLLLPMFMKRLSNNFLGLITSFLLCVFFTTVSTSWLCIETQHMTTYFQRAWMWRRQLRLKTRSTVPSFAGRRSRATPFSTMTSAENVYVTEWCIWHHHQMTRC